MSVMPTNLYVPTNYFDLLSGHILAASLLVKIDAAVRDGRDTVEIWSSSAQPRREFPHFDDLADAVVFLMMVRGGADQYRRRHPRDDHGASPG